MCDVCAAGGLRELREEVKAARHTENKLIREVRRLEEQLLSRQASAKTRSQVENLAPGGGKAASSLRALERAEYQQRLREAEQENADLRRQVERYQTKLVGLQMAAWEEAQDREEGRTPAHSNVVPQHSVASPSTHNTAVLARLGAISSGQTVEDAAPPPSTPKDGGIGTVQEALLREDQARREWLRAAGKLPGGQSRIDVGSHSSRVRSIGVQASTRIPHELTGDDSDVEGTAQDGDNETDGEGKTLISALKAELQKKNAFVQALQDKSASLQAFVDRAHVQRNEQEQRMLAMDVKVREALKARDDVVRERDGLANQLRLMRLDRSVIDLKDLELAEMRETLEQVESDNNDLTFQALEAIWKGSISGGNAGSFAGAAAAPRDASSLSAGPGHQDNVRADHMLAATSRAEPGSLGASGAASAGSPTVSRQSASATGGRTLSSGQTAGGTDASTASPKVKAASASRGTAPRAQPAADESVAEATRRIVAAMLSQFDNAGAAHAQHQALFNWLNKMQGKAIGKGSKSITIAQLQAGVAALQLSPPVSKTNERAVLDAIDSDGSGAVEYTELVAFVQEHRSKLPAGGPPPSKAVADAAASHPAAAAPHVSGSAVPGRAESVASKMSLAEEVEEDIAADVGEVDAGSVYGGGGAGDESMHGEISIDGPATGDGLAASLMSLASFDSDTAAGGHAITRSGDHAGFQSLGDLESQDMAQLTPLLNATTRELMLDPSRAWIIPTLKQLYQDTKDRRFPNRIAFYDAVAVKLLQPLQGETAQLKKNLEESNKFYSEKLRREVKELVCEMEALKGRADLLARQKEVLQDHLQTLGRDLRGLHSQHLSLLDILRLLSLGAIDYHAVLANKRQADVRASVAAAGERAAENHAREREKLIAEKARFEEAYNLLLEYWYYLPADAHGEANQRLARAGIQTVRVDEGGVLYLPPNTTNYVVRAIYGDPDSNTQSWTDVTLAVRALVENEGIPKTVVSGQKLAPFLFKPDLTSQSALKADKEGTAQAQGEAAGRNKLVLSYAPSERTAGQSLDTAWFLRRQEAEMAGDALHSLANLLVQWGVSVDEFMHDSLGLGDEPTDKGVVGQELKWETLISAVRELPVQLGGEKELRAALDLGRSSPVGSLSVTLVRSKIEAQYWCLVANGLREFVRNASLDQVPSVSSLSGRRFGAAGVQQHGSLEHGRAQQRPRSSMSLGSEQSAAIDGQESDAWANVLALERRVQEAENRICMQALYIESLQISLGFTKLLADHRDPKQELNLLMQEAEHRAAQKEEHRRKLQEQMASSVHLTRISH